MKCRHHPLWRLFTVFSTLCFANAVLVVWAVWAQGEQVEVPKKLTWKNIDRVEQYLRLKPADENYQKTTWHSTVIAGQRKAQKEDKPLLLWLYFGDPRGNC